MIGLAILACGSGNETSTWEARGVVRDVAPNGRQIVIEHEVIPDLMPAMTMNFELADPLSASQLRPGQSIEFTLGYTLQGLRVLRITAVGESGAPSHGTRFAGLVEVGTAAPEFALVDQAGDPFALRGLRGKAVLLDFVFTNCPGPCPIQTAAHVRLHRALDSDMRERIHFVSVSLDPVRDTPGALLAYAEQLDVDLEAWSFVTGETLAVEAILGAYGVGRVVSDDGNIDHLLVSYLIDPRGRVASRYLGSAGDVDEIRLDIERALASTRRERGVAR